MKQMMGLITETDTLTCTELEWTCMIVNAPQITTTTRKNDL